MRIDKIFIFGIVMILLSSFVFAECSGNSCSSAEAHKYPFNNDYDDDWGSLDGTGQNSPTFVNDREGNSNEAVNLDGTNQYVTTSSSSIIDADADWTILFRDLRLDDNSKTVQTLYGEYDTDNDRWGFDITGTSYSGSGEGLRFFYRAGGSTLITLECAFSWINGNWYNISLTKSDNNYYFDINQNRICSLSNPNSLSANSGDVSIGAFTFSTPVYLNGAISEINIWNNALNQETLYNYTLYSIYEIPIFELTAFNYYDNSSINTFSAEIDNSTTTKTIFTNNGTIFWKDNNIVNITIFNLTGNDDTYFNRTYLNYNTSNDLNSSHWQSVLILNAYENFTNDVVGIFNTTVGTSFNTSNSTNQTTHYLNADNYNVTGVSQFYNDNATLQVSLSNLEILETNITFANYIDIEARDINTSESINNFTITTPYQTITTTNGSIYNVFCDYPSCNIQVNATPSDYLLKNFTHGALTETLIANLSSAKIYLRFLTADTLEAIFNTTITITTPDNRTLTRQTDTGGYVNISALYEQSEVFGHYNYTFGGTEGFVSPVSFNAIINDTNLPFNESYGIGRVGLTFRALDRETGELLTGVRVDFAMLTRFNASTITGVYTETNLTIATGDYIVQAISDGYGVEQREFTYTGQANVTLNFYLLNLTGDNTGTVFASVVDEFYRVQPNADVQLYEYRPELLSYVVVSERQTNVNGECTFYIELGVKTYYITASKNIGGTLYEDSTNPEIISTDEEVRNLFLRFTETFESFNINNIVININETFENNISRIIADWDTRDNTDVTICLQFYERLLNYDDSTYLNCITSNSGSFDQSFSLNRSKTYYARMYYVSDAGTDYNLESWVYPKITSFSSLFLENNYSKPFILFLWIGLIGLSLYLKNVSMLAIGGILLSWFEVALFPNLLIISGSVIKTMIGITMLFISRKRQDNL